MDRLELHHEPRAKFHIKCFNPTGPQVACEGGHEAPSCAGLSCHTQASSSCCELRFTVRMVWPPWLILQVY